MATKTTKTAATKPAKTAAAKPTKTVKITRKPRSRATRYFLADGKTVRMKDSDGRALKLACPGCQMIEYREYSDGRAVTTVWLAESQRNDGRIRGMLNAALNASGVAPVLEQDE